MIKHTIQLMIVITVGCLAAGCAIKNTVIEKSTKPLYALDTVAIETNRNVQKLTAIKTAQMQKTNDHAKWQSYLFNLQAIPSNFEQKATFHFVGTAQEAMKGLADLAGYEATFVGNPPAQPILVSLDINNQPLIQALRDLNAQLNNQASIQIVPNAKLLTLTFGA